MHYCQEDITEGSGPHRPQLDDAQQLLGVAVRVAGGRGNHVSARVEDVILTVRRNILWHLGNICYLDVSDDMERGLLLSRGSEPTGARGLPLL